MKQESQNSSILVKILGSATLASLIAIAALTWSIYSTRLEDLATQQQLANQATQIAKQDVQISLNAELNELLFKQATIEAQKAELEALLHPTIPTNNADFAPTLTAIAMQASRIDSTRQAIDAKQQEIEATQTAIAESVPLTTETSFTVFANQGWSNSGLNIETGDLIEIKYESGKWTYWSGQVPLHDGNGNPDYVCTEYRAASRCVEPVPEAAKGALIARIGSAKPTFVGNQANFTALNSGPLYLWINDSTLTNDSIDNEGFLVVRIILTKSN